MSQLTNPRFTEVVAHFEQCCAASREHSQLASESLREYGDQGAQTMEYRVLVNNAEQSEEPQVSRVTAKKELFDQWWSQAETFAMNRGLYAVGQYREQDSSAWQTLVEFES